MGVVYMGGGGVVKGMGAEWGGFVMGMGVGDGGM